ncbi:hypothetical protein CTA2_7702 [Colletotrichum tanaceti]|uniref:Uncharacterized protein n=1 Tax=Colletotrichum tanaceti TaxID=1306861 RepID=A0A4U6X2Z0_9PEZI|nr:hypothetical protein CTA2_7702 [Colletotrichum tanaceti]TKW49374.1 hypothetical protein CTA1_4014 [Colletotrichum tanaceti]
MSLRVTDECWDRWGAVIRHLASEYGFPAGTKRELNVFLRLYRGGGSTFRDKRERWRFVIDTIRRDDVVHSIVAITLTSETEQKPRYNGAVITRACDVHPNRHGDDFVGAPDLQWVVVTSGGESYRHCCDKECNTLERVHAARSPRNNWEMTRLCIVQKAYEQEVIALNDRIETLSARVEEKSASKKKWKESSRKWRDQNGRLNETVSTVTQELAMANTEFNATIGSMTKDLKRAKVANASLRDRVQALEGENKSLGTRGAINEAQGIYLGSRRAKDEIAALRGQNQTLERKIQDMERRSSGLVGEKDKLQGQIHSMTMEAKALVQETEVMEQNCGNADTRIKELSNDIKKLKDDMELAEMDHVVSKEKMRVQIERLTGANTKLESEKDGLDRHLADLEAENRDLAAQATRDAATIGRLEATARLGDDRAKQLEAALDKTRRESQGQARQHAEQVARLERAVREKRYDGGDDDATHHPPRTPQAEELERQRAISREAHERAADLRSKLDAAELLMEAKAAEMVALERKCAAAEARARAAEERQSGKTTTAAAAAAAASREEETQARLRELEKRCAEKTAAAFEWQAKCEDRNTYTLSLEKDVEEMRSVMEGVLGRVSVHQGRKRRRTEGPDFKV